MPDFETARERYGEILRQILAYADYCDANGDEDGAKYRELEDALHKITGKDMSNLTCGSGEKRTVRKIWLSISRYPSQIWCLISQRTNCARS